MRDNESIKLARLWAAMDALKRQLDGELIPLAVHVGVGIIDPELMIALEELSAKIERHFERFTLQAGVREKR